MPDTSFLIFPSTKLIFSYSRIMLVAQGHSVTDSYTHIFLPLCPFWPISSQVIAEIPFLLSIWSFTFVLLYLIPFALLHFLRSYSSSFSSHILPLAVLHPRYNTVLVFSSRLLFSHDSPFATGKKKRGTRSNTRSIHSFIPVKLLPVPCCWGPSRLCPDGLLHLTPDCCWKELA